MHPALETLAVIRDALAENQLDAAKALQAEVDGEWCDCIVYTMDAFKASFFGTGTRGHRLDCQFLPIPPDVQQARRDRVTADARRTIGRVHTYIGAFHQPVMPDPYADLPASIRAVQESYYRARELDAPESVLENMRDFVCSAVAMLHGQLRHHP